MSNKLKKSSFFAGETVSECLNQSCRFHISAINIVERYDGIYIQCPFCGAMFNVDMYMKYGKEKKKYGNTND